MTVKKFYLKRKIVERVKALQTPTLLRSGQRAESELGYSTYLSPILIRIHSSLPCPSTTTVPSVQVSSRFRQVSCIRFLYCRVSVMSTKVYVGSVLCVCPRVSPQLLLVSGGARLIAIDTSCSNLSWNTTDETLRQVSLV